MQPFIKELPNLLNIKNADGREEDVFAFSSDPLFPEYKHEDNLSACICFCIIENAILTRNKPMINLLIEKTNLETLNSLKVDYIEKEIKAINKLLIQISENICHPKKSKHAQLLKDLHKLRVSQHIIFPKMLRTFLCYLYFVLKKDVKPDQLKKFLSNGLYKENFEVLFQGLNINIELIRLNKDSKNSLERVKFPRFNKGAAYIKIYTSHKHDSKILYSRENLLSFLNETAENIRESEINTSQKLCDLFLSLLGKLNAFFEGISVVAKNTLSEDFTLKFDQLISKEYTNNVKLKEEIQKLDAFITNRKIPKTSEEANFHKKSKEAQGNTNRVNAIDNINFNPALPCTKNLQMKEEDPQLQLFYSYFDSIKSNNRNTNNLEGKDRSDKENNARLLHLISPDQLFKNMSDTLSKRAQNIDKYNNLDTSQQLNNIRELPFKIQEGMEAISAQGNMLEDSYVAPPNDNEYKENNLFPAGILYNNAIYEKISENKNDESKGTFVEIEESIIREELILPQNEDIPKTERSQTFLSPTFCESETDKDMNTVFNISADSTYRGFFQGAEKEKTKINIIEDKNPLKMAKKILDLTDFEEEKEESICSDSVSYQRSEICQICEKEPLTSKIDIYSTCESRHSICEACLSVYIIKVMANLHPNQQIKCAVDGCNEPIYDYYLDHLVDKYSKENNYKRKKLYCHFCPGKNLLNIDKDKSIANCQDCGFINIPDSCRKGKQNINIIDHFFNFKEIQIGICPYCYKINYKELYSDSELESFHNCESCKNSFCYFCSAPKHHIDLHGTSYHRKECPNYINFTNSFKKSFVKCKECLSSLKCDFPQDIKPYFWPFMSEAQLKIFSDINRLS